MPKKRPNLILSLSYNIPPLSLFTSDPLIHSRTLNKKRKKKVQAVLFDLYR